MIRRHACACAALPWLLLPLLVVCAGCDRTPRIPEGSVIVDIHVSHREAEQGVVRTVKAPDYELYDLVIRPGIQDGALLSLPPKVAAHYAYPLFFRVNLVENLPKSDVEPPAPAP